MKWSYGCPSFAPCCSEFGYCRPLSEWEYGAFRDCNGVSNGTPLPPETLAAEAAAGPYHGEPAGKIGPPPEFIKQNMLHGYHHDHHTHHPVHASPHLLPHPPHDDHHHLPHPSHDAYHHSPLHKDHHHPPPPLHENHHHPPHPLHEDHPHPPHLTHEDYHQPPHPSYGAPHQLPPLKHHNPQPVHPHEPVIHHTAESYLLPQPHDPLHVDHFPKLPHNHHLNHPVPAPHVNVAHPPPPSLYQVPHHDIHHDPMHGLDDHQLSLPHPPPAHPPTPHDIHHFTPIKSLYTTPFVNHPKPTQYHPHGTAIPHLPSYIPPTSPPAIAPATFSPATTALFNIPSPPQPSLLTTPSLLHDQLSHTQGTGLTPFAPLHQQNSFAVTNNVHHGIGGISPPHPLAVKPPVPHHHPAPVPPQPHVFNQPLESINHPHHGVLPPTSPIKNPLIPFTNHGSSIPSLTHAAAAQLPISKAPSNCHSIAPGSYTCLSVGPGSGKSPPPPQHHLPFDTALRQQFVIARRRRRKLSQTSLRNELINNGLRLNQTLPNPSGSDIATSQMLQSGSMQAKNYVTQLPLTTAFQKYKIKPYIHHGEFNKNRKRKTTIAPALSTYPKKSELKDVDTSTRKLVDTLAVTRQTPTPFDML